MQDVVRKHSEISEGKGPRYLQFTLKLFKKKKKEMRKKNRRRANGEMLALGKSG